MIRIKEILAEKNMTVSDLAVLLGVSRQALSKQIQGKMLVETAVKIANALDVSLWELFASPEEATEKNLVAFIHFKGESHIPTTIEQILAVLEGWDGAELHRACHRRIAGKILSKRKDDAPTVEMLEKLGKALEECLD